jgi:hypothetical protein
VGSEDQPSQPVLQEKQFDNHKLLNTNKEEVINAAMKLPYKRGITWNKEFPQEVKEQAVRDEEYLEALQSLSKEDQKTESTLHQEEGVLYRKVKPWVPYGL